MSNRWKLSYELKIGSLIRLTDYAINKYGEEYRDVLFKVLNYYTGAGETTSGLHPDYNSSLNIDGQPRLVLVECLNFPHLLYGFPSGISEDVIKANPNVEFELTPYVSCAEVTCQNKAVARLSVEPRYKPWKYSIKNLCADHLYENILSLPQVPCEKLELDDRTGLRVCADCNCLRWTGIAFVTPNNELTQPLFLCQTHLLKRVNLFLETGNIEEASQRVRIEMPLFGKTIKIKGYEKKPKLPTYITSDMFDVDLSDGLISKIDLRPLVRHPNMTSLDLSNNYLETLDLSPLAVCTKQLQLSLHNNNLTSLDLDALKDYLLLEEINLSGNKLTHLDLSPLSKCRRLKRIDLSRNRLRYLDCSPVLTLPNLEMIAVDLNTIIIISQEVYRDPDLEDKMTRVFRPHIPEFQRYVTFQSLTEKEAYYQSLKKTGSITDVDTEEKVLTRKNATWQDLLKVIYNTFDSLSGSYGGSDQRGYDGKLISNMYPSQEYEKELIYNESTLEIFVTWSGSPPPYTPPRSYNIYIRRMLKDYTLQKQHFSFCTRNRDTARACANFIQDWLIDLSY